MRQVEQILRFLNRSPVIFTHVQPSDLIGRHSGSVEENAVIWHVVQRTMSCITVCQPSHACFCVFLLPITLIEAKIVSVQFLEALFTSVYDLVLVGSRRTLIVLDTV